MTPPGLATVAVSAAAREHAARATLPRYYLDWERTRRAQAKLDSAFTPAVSLVVSLDVALGLLLEDVVERRGAQRVVEGDGGGVPVEHRPLEPGQPLGHAAAGEIGQQRLARAQPSRLRPHEQVFQVDPVPTLEGRVVVEPQDEADRLTIRLGDVAKRPR